MGKNSKIVLGLIVLFLGFLIIYNLELFSNNRPIEQNDIVIEKKDDSVNNIENDVSREKGPLIEVDKQSFDFGIVKYGDVAKHVFTIKNAGTENLEILKLSTSCGCTKASVADEDKIIKPGKSVALVVTFDPAVHKDDSDLGVLKRIVYIKTNDFKNSEIEIEITANVIK